jgi:hypothetical protein
MDSDDEFNSSMSGDDFMDDQDSDMGIEDGMALGAVHLRVTD